MLLVKISLDAFIFIKNFIYKKILINKYDSTSNPSVVSVDKRAFPETSYYSSISDNRSKIYLLIRIAELSAHSSFLDMITFITKAPHPFF